MVWSCYDWNAQMSAMPGMWVQSAVCADVARCGSGMLGMWPRGSRNLLLAFIKHYCYIILLMGH